MDKAQKLLVAVAIISVGILYFGFSTVSSHDGSLEREDENRSSRTVFLLDSDIEEVRKGLSIEDRMKLDSLESLEGPVKLQELSSFWAKRKEWLLAAQYADELAQERGDSMSWSIAGNTYALAIHAYDGDKSRITDRARESYLNAAKAAPNWIEPQINRALVWIETPPEANPMSGVTELLSLQEKYPKNAAILYHLGRLGVSTGQYQKAKARLEEAESLAPKDRRIVCLLAQVYGQLGETKRAADYKRKCDL